jgi:hypothetical protein
MFSNLRIKPLGHVNLTVGKNHTRLAVDPYFYEQIFTNSPFFYGGHRNNPYF